jgi:hypothetical protein
MKTEDIDKRIGMPDVDAEWAKFEREVIGKEASTTLSEGRAKSYKNIVLRGFSIAASIALVAGIFIFGNNAKDTEQLQAELTTPTQQPSVGADSCTSLAPQSIDETDDLHDGDATPMLATERRPSEELLATGPIVPEGVQSSAKESPATQPTESAPAQENSTETVYSCEEVMPQFPGGEAALKQFVEENLRYPDLAKEYGVGGRILITFIVDTLGQMNDIKVSRSNIKFNSARFTQEPADRQEQLKKQITEQMNEEALRIINLVSKLPRWTPGTQSGKPVRVRYSVPVTFRATEPDKTLAKTRIITISLA